MMISTKGRYALRVMLDLAQQEPGAFISLKEISTRQEISIKYLEAIVSNLHKAGLLESQRGKDGGYRLRRAAEAYTVREIMQATEGNLAPVACLQDGESDCPRSASCLTLPLWQKLSAQIDSYLDAVSLADVLQGRL